MPGKLLSSAIAPSEWGARVDYDRWSDPDLSKDKWILHYGGPAVVGAFDGPAREMEVLRAWEEYHIDGRGWRGLAYSYLIGMSGILYRGRGEKVGGHTRGDYEPDRISENREGRAVCFILGGNQKPTEAALDTFRSLWLEDPLPVIGHGDVFDHGEGGTSTACPGPHLEAFIREEAYMAQFTEEEAKELKGFVAALKEVGSNAGFVVHLIPDIRANIITKAELDAAIAAALRSGADLVIGNAELEKLAELIGPKLKIVPK